MEDSEEELQLTLLVFEETLLTEETLLAEENLLIPLPHSLRQISGG